MEEGVLLVLARSARGRPGRAELPGSRASGGVQPGVDLNRSADLEVRQFTELLLGQPHCIRVQPAEGHWEIFTRLCREADARGNLVPDAWFAAMAIEAGCEWVTLDRDYARFSGLKWRPPD